VFTPYDRDLAKRGDSILFVVEREELASSPDFQRERLTITDKIPLRP
jgi:hypothetical protein